MEEKRGRGENERVRRVCEIKREVRKERVKERSKGMKD